MKLTKVEHDPFRRLRAEGGMTLQRTEPFPEKPEGYEFYGDEGAGSSAEALPGFPETSGVGAPQNGVLSSEGMSGFGQMIKGVGDWYASQPSWADQAKQQTQKDIEAYQTAGIPGLMADTQKTQELAGAFAGSVTPEVKAAQAVSQPFYSAVERIASDIPQGKASGEQWLATLRNRGAKPEEMQWLGLEDFLKEQKGPVTKQQVLDHIAENKIEVQEVMKGERPEGSPFIGGEWVGPGRYRMENGDEWSPTTKYSQWQLPGGENYRELLLTLPTRDPPVTLSRVEPVGGGYNVYYSDGTSEHLPRITSAADAVNAGNARIEAGVKVASTKQLYDFRSSHFDEPNVLAHIRFNDRVIDGKKTLFIEEVQSDFGEATRSSREQIAKAVDRDFDTIADKMVKDGLITKVCD